MARGGRCGRLCRPHHGRRIVLRNSFRRSGECGGHQRRARDGGEGLRLPGRTGARVFARPGVRRDAGQARVPGHLRISHRSAANGPVHPAQPAVSRTDAGSVRRDTALPGAAWAPASEHSRGHARSIHEHVPELGDSGEFQLHSMKTGPLKTELSDALFARAQAVIPGGVNSPVRAFRGVGGTPRFISRGEGSRIFDVDGNAYIDYVCSWGPLLLGHRPAPVVEALREVLEEGTSFGAPTEREVSLAELISKAVPSMEMVRLVNSGTEATMSALRLARGFTGRDLTVKFEGCYHGHVDSLLVKAGSGMAT